MSSDKADPTAHCPRRPTWAEVDLVALLHNYRLLNSLLLPDAEPAGERTSSIQSSQSATRNPRLIPVLKADAYGHGAAAVAKALAAAGATTFAVALVEEAVELRAAGITQEIVILEGAWPGQETELARHGFTAAVYSTDGIHRLEEAAEKDRRPIRVHIKIDTGMTRLGVPWEAMNPVLETLHHAALLRPTGVFSHLASAEEDDPDYTSEQIRRFEHALLQVRRAGNDPGEVHLANSAGLLHWPQLRHYSARPGIALYGYPPAPHRCSLSFQPALTVKSRVGPIHSIPPGESVGYNRRFIARRPTRTATLPIGYADGYRRGLTARGSAIIRDRLAPVIGAVSMDMIVVDVTDLPEVCEGEEVILLGSTSRCRFDAADWAGLLDTIPYEILCGVGSRIPRIYQG